MRTTTVPGVAAMGSCCILSITPALAKPPEKPVKMTAVNDVQKTKPRRERGRPDEVLAELTPRGRELEAAYKQKLASLRAEIESALPALDPSKKEACVAALQAVRAAEKNLDSKRHAFNVAIRHVEAAPQAQPQRLAVAPPTSSRRRETCREGQHDLLPRSQVCNVTLRAPRKFLITPAVRVCIVTAWAQHPKTWSLCAAFPCSHSPRFSPPNSPTPTASRRT